MECKIEELNAIYQMIEVARNKKESLFYKILWKSLLSDLAHEKGFTEYSKELLKQKEGLVEEFNKSP